MTTYKRIKGGEKNEKTGLDWTRPELESVCDLYIELGGIGIHENNPQIHKLAKKLNRTIRSVENQLLGFKKVATQDTGRKNYNRLIPIIWKKKNGNTERKKKDNDFQFRISAALKDIIGQDLITDDYIAVFELVKNAYDAYCSRVDIYFEAIYTEDAKIIIKDNGKGMDVEDLKNKWLFVAYSAKREGTEDDNFDYRNSIYKNRAFAGAKGIGRFSCDRLGQILYLETTKQKQNSQTEILITDWGKFEEDSSNEFVDIGIEHLRKSKSDYGLTHGTVLEISELRSTWDRAKILRLKSSLAKLINPNKGKGEQSFKIFIHSDDEKIVDREQSHEKDKVNGEIKNFIFEELGLKTTKIFSTISADGKYITTELIDGGTLIYRIKEKNKYELLDSIDYTLFYLNQPAKITFISRMGVSSKDYGHIFLYKNGFRIYPYGEPGDDPLKIDVRKTQGTRRFLGTRELIGQIEIFSETDQLKETSSRGDGLRKTDTYSQLEECFWEILKRLERYVVDVQKWGLSIEGEGSKDVKNRITKLIANLSKSNSILEFEYEENLLDFLETSQLQSATRVIKNLRRIAIENGDNALLKEIDAAEKSLKEMQLQREEAEKEANEERERAVRAEKELKEQSSENLFLKSIKSQDLDEIVSFMHHIGISASIIDNYLSGLYKMIDTPKSYNTNEVKDFLRTTIFENKKIINITKFATKANFKLYTDAIELNLDQYISEYIRNIVTLATGKQFDIQFKNENKQPLIRKFRPLEINILIDNLINNSKKAKASRFDIKISRTKNNQFQLEFIDNGIGISPDRLKQIFDFGYTTTTGSGIGLFHVKEIVNRLNGDISVSSTLNKGTKFTIVLK
jgi:signal transduction histidine kinase